MAFAQQTYGLIKFAKVAYPDLVSGHSPPDLEEPLLEKNKQACRYVLFVQYNPFKISYVMLKKTRQKIGYITCPLVSLLNLNLRGKSGSFVQRQKLIAIYHVKKLVKDSQQF